MIKQVHESDTGFDRDASNILDMTTTAEPLETSIEESSGTDLTQENSRDSEASEIPTTEPFSTHAKRNSGGLGFWNTFEHTPPNQIDRYRTPPPPSLLPQDSNASEDNNAFSTTPFHENSHAGSLIRHLHNSRSRSRSTTPLVCNQRSSFTAQPIRHEDRNYSR